MNKQNIELLFQNYIDNFDYLNDPNGGYETYKWEAIEQVQKVWDLAAPDLSGMIKQAFSKTYNLINNRIVSPGNGLALLAKEEPEAVRKALEDLLSETADVDEKQSNILSFVDTINVMLEKHYPGKWKYTHDVRVAITYLALIVPSENYLFKSTPAHYFARWMGFDTDLGYGADFKLKYYYRMCDELLADVNACPELLKKDAERKCSWRDPSKHVLVTDLIYCFGVYPVMRAGLNEPPTLRKKKNSAEAQQAERAKRAEELQARLNQMQDEIDAIQEEIDALPIVDLTGKTVQTKLYGPVTVELHEGSYLSFTAEGKKREFALPGCVVNGFVIPEDQVVVERYRKEAELQEKIQKLNSEQRLVNLEYGKY
ncbi:MAG: hypothetical protein IJ719_08735 [Clostridia bacterium]|nr:hypothetical protein [Clostridia bacterium]